MRSSLCKHLLTKKICICQNIEFPKMFVKIQTNQCQSLFSECSIIASTSIAYVSGIGKHSREENLFLSSFSCLNIFYRDFPTVYPSDFSAFAQTFLPAKLSLANSFSFSQFSLGFCYLGVVQNKNKPLVD